MRQLFYGLFAAGLCVCFSSGAAFAQAGSLSSSPAAQTPWTFLIFLNGDNSLDSYGPYNIKEMEKVGSTQNVNVVVQWASESRGTTQRLLIQKSSDPNNVTSPVVQDMGKVDMGDYNQLIAFVNWGVANYPAQHYFIDVWDHGNGWHFQDELRLFQASPFSLGQAMPVPFTNHDISWDDGSGHFITTVELGQAIAAAAQTIGHKVDLYASDACLMAMPEVAGEMMNSVQIYGGSEETEPSEGWPYDALLTQWNALGANAQAADVGKILTDTYVTSYENGEHGTSDVTFAAYDMTQYAQMVSSVTSLGTALSGLTASGKAAAVAAIGKTQTYDVSDYGDLVDFTNQLAAKNVDVGPAILQAVQAAVSSFVIDNKVTAKYENSHGVSIWLPATADTLNAYWTAYTGLAWQKATNWGGALKSILGVN